MHTLNLPKEHYSTEKSSNNREIFCWNEEIEIWLKRADRSPSFMAPLLLRFSDPLYLNLTGDVTFVRDTYLFLDRTASRCSCVNSVACTPSVVCWTSRMQSALLVAVENYDFTTWSNLFEGGRCSFGYSLLWLVGWAFSLHNNAQQLLKNISF